MRYFRTGIGIVVAVIMAVGWGCSEGGDGGAAEPAFRKDYRTEEESGSEALVEVMLDRTAITTAETVRLEVVAECGLEDSPTFWEVPGKWGKWTVADVSQVERSALAGGRVRARRSYRLEPYLPGDYVIPEFHVRFGKPGGAASAIKVAEIPVVVASVLGGDPDGADLAEPYTDVEIEEESKMKWWWIGGGAAVAVVLAGGLFYVIFKGKGRQEVAGPTEREIFASQLDDLLGHETVDAMELAAVAGRVSGLREELKERIEGLAFSREGRCREMAGDEVRKAAEELRAFLNVGTRDGKGGER